MPHILGTIRLDNFDLNALQDIVIASQPEVVFPRSIPLVRLSYSDPLGTWSTL